MFAFYYFVNAFFFKYKYKCPKIEKICFPFRIVHKCVCIGEVTPCLLFKLSYI